MTIARKYQISLESTPYYHIMTRCVRRAFLCGKDKYTGNCFEHRRKMIVERIEFLASSFNIDVCAYAIMSNHYHLVLKINSTKNWNEMIRMDRHHYSTILQVFRKFATMFC